MVGLAIDRDIVMIIGDRGSSTTLRREDSEMTIPATNQHGNAGNVRCGGINRKRCASMTAHNPGFMALSELASAMMAL